MTDTPPTLKIPSGPSNDIPGREGERDTVADDTSELTMYVSCRLFDNDRISVIFYLETIYGVPYVFIRTSEGDQQWIALRGAHELVIKREGRDGSSLMFWRWSKSEQQRKRWARLQFITWEG